MSIDQTLSFAVLTREIAATLKLSARLCKTFDRALACLRARRVSIRHKLELDVIAERRINVVVQTSSYKVLTAAAKRLVEERNSRLLLLRTLRIAATRVGDVATLRKRFGFAP